MPAINESLATYLTSARASETVSSEQIAEHLTETLRQHDKHFTLGYQPPSANENKPRKLLWFARLERQNYGFTSLEILDKNVGVLDFWGFAAVNALSKQKVSSVMTFLSDVDALIIDLRNNGGGSGEMVHLISSYFVDGKVHLNSLYTRHTDVTQEFWTTPEINNNHLENIPLYILISGETFSAAEEFTYNFQQMKRATIVGEASKGGANPWRWYPLAEDFRIGIPITKAINPVTQSNWEGVGVQSDVDATGKNALDVAYALALDAIQNQ
ncbi:hypothetical protein DRW07_06675 [Alteromonas sediminis]|uniref:Tail specific protease domain-containing protein n=1 Tax=Alteromonas sediminis TaxID=2259342 RepID=A0A3N5Z8L1_9ALTE|nr:hypothetical protein DRW07_06675 [Alteromonas sediminis]